MSISFIENQPVIFENDNCDYLLEYQRTDTVSFQLIKQPCQDADNLICNPTFSVDGDNQVSNGDFDTDLSGWTYDSNVWHWVLGKAACYASGDFTFLQAIPILVPGKAYTFRISVTNNVAVSKTFSISLGGLGVIANYSSTSNEDIEVLLPAYVTDSIDELKIYGFGSLSGISIDNIELVDVCWQQGEDEEPVLTFGDNGVCKEESTNPVTLTEDIVLAANSDFSVLLTIGSYTSGDVSITVGGVTFDPVQGQGTFFFSGNNGSDGQTVTLNFSSDFVGCISNLEVSLTATLRIDILDKNNNYINTLNDEDVAIVGTRVNVTTNMADYIDTDGCYKFAIADDCGREISISNLVLNGDFSDNDDHWGDATGFGFTYNKACFLSSDDDNNIAQTLSDLIVGQNYVLIFTLSNMNNAEVTPTLGGSDDSVLYIENGTYQLPITPINSDPLNFLFNNTDAEFSACITDIKVIKVLSVNDYDATSNLIKFSNNECCDGLLLKYRCNSSSFGFDFRNATFFFYLRIPAKIKRAKYPEDNEQYDYSSGVKSIPYFRTRKLDIMKTGFLAAFVHDCLSIIKGCDTVYINDVLYVFEKGEYTLQNNDADESDLALGVLELSKKTQKLVKRNCSEADPLDGDYLLDPDTGDFVVSLE